MIPESKGRCIERRVSDTRYPNEMDSEQKCFAIKHMEKWHIWFTRTKIKWKVYMRENSLTSTGPGVSTINDWDREKNNNGMILDTRRMFTMKNYSCSFLMRMKSRCDMALALSFALMPQPFGVCVRVRHELWRPPERFEHHFSIDAFYIWNINVQVP